MSSIQCLSTCAGIKPTIVPVNWVNSVYQMCSACLVGVLKNREEPLWKC